MYDLQGEVAGHVPVAPQQDVPKIPRFLLHAPAHCCPVCLPHQKHHLTGFSRTRQAFQIICQAFAWPTTDATRKSRTHQPAVAPNHGEGPEAWHSGSPVRWWGTAGATAQVSSNAGAQPAPGRGEAWASGAGKARYLSQHHPLSHASCILGLCCRGTLTL